MSLTMDDVLEIVKPHNDRIVAEARLSRAEAKLEELYGQIYALKSALGSCAALMQADIDDGRATATPTRTQVIAKARELS
jgi:hypothetical protein